MPELDHLIFASPSLDEGIQHIEALTGAVAVAGGPHPGAGSHNALLAFNAATYFEIIAIDPSQPEPSRPRSFGLDVTTEPRLAGYAIRPSPGETLNQVAEAMRSVGFDPGSVRDMSRLKPDGEHLHWRLTTLGQPSLPVSTNPFIIDWGDTPNQAATLPSMGSLVSLTVLSDDEATKAVVDALGLEVCVQPGDSRLIAAVNTPNGAVEIF